MSPALLIKVRLTAGTHHSGFVFAAQRPALSSIPDNSFNPLEVA